MLWLTDRSRVETGLGFCKRARMLQYHAGSTGAGLRRKSEAIPLARGTYFHEGLEYILRFGHAADDAVIRAAATRAAAAYRTRATASGLANLDQSDRAETLIAEQASLVEALIWCWALELLPWLLEEYDVVAVEEPGVHVLGCTCGLSDGVGTRQDHEARDCQGIGWMHRLDAILRKKSNGRLHYWEWKTTGSTGERWETQWELQPQFAAGGAIVEARLGEPVDELWVGGMICGYRQERDYDPILKKGTGPKIQNTPLIYGYYSPGIPALKAPAWAGQYNYVGQDGKNHRLTKDYQKRSVWDATFEGQPEGMSAVEYWVKWLPSEVRRKQLQVVGPLNPQQQVVAQMFDETIWEERKWQGDLWELYRNLEDCQWDWTHRQYQGALNRLMPRSWACRRYGKSHQCEFVKLCHEQEGWETPLEHGYVLRKPHHVGEVEQLKERGVEVPESWDEEEGEEER